MRDAGIYDATSRGASRLGPLTVVTCRLDYYNDDTLSHYYFSRVRLIISRIYRIRKYI